MTDNPTNERPNDAPPAPEAAGEEPASTQAASDAMPARAPVAEGPDATPTPSSAARYVPDPSPSDEAKPGRRFTMPVIRRPVDPVLAITAGVLGLLALLFALMLFAPGVMPVKIGAARGAGSTEDIQEVARRFSETLLTFSYKTLDTHLDRVADDATGAFEKRYVDTLGQLRKQLTDAKADSAGSVVDVAVSPPTDETARAVVTVQRTIKNDKTPEPQTTPAILELSLVKTSDGWKIDNVGQLQRVQL